MTAINIATMIAVVLIVGARPFWLLVQLRDERRRRDTLPYVGPCPGCHGINGGRHGPDCPYRAHGKSGPGGQKEGA